MSFLGIVGGGIVIAMCLPVFNLISKLAYLELPRGRLVGPRTGLTSTNDALLMFPIVRTAGDLLGIEVLDFVILEGYQTRRHHAARCAGAD